MSTAITTSELADAQREALAWGDLVSSLKLPAARPPDSMTPAELSEATGLSEVHARAILRRRAQLGELRAVEYLTAGRRRAVAYVRAV